jgi:hypothetical protein
MLPPHCAEKIRQDLSHVVQQKTHPPNSSVTMFIQGLLSLPYKVSLRRRKKLRCSESFMFSLSLFPDGQVFRLIAQSFLAV